MSKYIVLTLIMGLVACSEQPDVHMSTGESVQFGDYAGRYLLINYWAEWCHPCLEEIPELNALASGHSEEIAVIGVNFDGVQAEELLRQQKRLAIQFPVVTMDPAAIFHYSPPEVLPTSYLIDQNQKLVATLVGPQTRQSILALLTTGTDE